MLSTAFVVKTALSIRYKTLYIADPHVSSNATSRKNTHDLP